MVIKTSKIFAFYDAWKIYTYLYIETSLADVTKILDGPPIKIGDVQLQMSYYLRDAGPLDDTQFQLMHQKPKQNDNDTATSMKTNFLKNFVPF